MAKFPDPTKEYKAQPVGSAVDANTFPSPEPTPSPIPEPPAPASPAPVEAVLSPSPFRNLIPLILGGGIFVILMFVAIRFLPSMFSKKTTEVNLNYWGLWEPSSVMQTVIADYERDNPGVKITYSMQSPKNYRSRLQSAIAAGTAPDIARIHNTWIPMLRRDLTPAPDSVFPTGSLASFYPIVKKNLTVGEKIYAVPLMIDGLALYYNVDILSSINVAPPTDWNALRKLAFDLTKTNPETGAIELSGVALGTTGNVDNWSDILGLLILQNSGDPSQPTSQAVQDALAFYTVFSTTDKTWDSSQPNSVYAFATGTVAMILAPSWQSGTIQAINPELKYKVIPAPTLPSTNLAWATYWAEAVPISSKNSVAAWDFIKYLSSRDTLQKLYATQAQLRPIGEIYPMSDMASLLEGDPIAGAFVSEAPNFVTWYMSGKTHDEGLNDGIIKYYEDAINSINDGTPIGSIITPLDSGIQQVLAKYPEAK